MTAIPPEQPFPAFAFGRHAGDPIHFGRSQSDP